MLHPSTSGKSFDWRGLSPGQLAAAQARWNEVVDFFLATTPPELAAERSTIPVLYVGSGFGAIHRVWVERGFQAVEGIELRPDRAAAAREYGCDVTVGDFQDLSRFEDGRFGLTVFDRVLFPADYRTQDPREYLAEALRVQAQRAAILIWFHGGWSPKDLRPFLELGEERGWDVAWGRHPRGGIHLTLFRGCPKPPMRSPRSWFGWVVTSRVPRLLGGRGF